MLWIALHFDRLALDVVARRIDPCMRPAIALCDRLRIVQSDDAARALGVFPGQKRATALALAPQLHCLTRDEAAERQALAQIAVWALQFTPHVSPQPPDGVLLEVGASLRLFGGRKRLLARLREGLTLLGYDAGIAAAPTAAGAWLLARGDPGACVDDVQLPSRLAPLPVALLAGAAAHGDTLAAIGSQTLGDLLQLPRNGLAHRFGSALLDEIDRALGRQPDARRWIQAPSTFDAKLELLAQVEQADALLFAARRLLAQLCGWLAARHSAVRQLDWFAEHDRDRRGRPPTRIELRLAEPTRELERLCAVLRERLAATRLPAPAHTLRLECRDVVELAPPSGELFATAASERDGLSRLIERLQARLGRDQVQRLLLANDHRPEHAYRIDGIDDPAARPARSARPPRPSSRAIRSAAGGGERGDTLIVPRPLWLLLAPVALEERDQRPWWHGPLRLLTPPERIESGWWDGDLVQRDYFIAEDDQARWFWIYRARRADAGAGWYLQGVFG